MRRQARVVRHRGFRLSCKRLLTLLVRSTAGVINVAYGYVHRRQATLGTPADVFHTRQLVYPVLVTVYQALECRDMDVLSLTPAHAGASADDDANTGGSEPVRALLRDADDDGWCLFAVDVRNTYGVPFEVTFERAQDGTPAASATCVVAPGSTTRCVAIAHRPHRATPR
jgi:hypothetical protein